MKFLDLAAERCSVRKFEQRPIEPDVMNKVLEAGRLAPSACNKQPWRYYIVETPGGMNLLNKCGRFFDAPAAIIVLGAPGDAWVRPQDNKNHLDIDVAITTDHMTLAATSLGLATCWVCWFDPALCKTLFSIPHGLEPIAILPIGYPVSTKHIRRHDHDRLDLDTLVIGRG